jgi:hypothetical protein
VDSREKMRFSLKNSKWTYCLETERTARSVIADVWSRAWTYDQIVIGELHFYQPSHSSCFPCSKVVLVEVGLIEGFPHIWRIRISWTTQRHYSTQVSFNSHNARCYFSMHCTSILCTKKTCIFATLIVYTWHT